MEFFAGFFWWVGVIVLGLICLIVLGVIVFIAWLYFSQPKCPRCGTRWTQDMIGGPPSCVKCRLSTPDYETYPEKNQEYWMRSRGF